MAGGATSAPLGGGAPVALLHLAWDTDGQPVVLAANALATELLGLDEASLTVLDLATVLSGEDAEALADAIEDARPDPSPPLLLRWGPTPPLTFVQVRVARRPGGEVIGALSDVTEQYRLDTIICGSGSGVFTTDLHRRVTWMSPMTEAVLGIPRQAFLGLDILTLVHPDDVAAVLVTIDEIAAHPGVETVRSYRLKHPLIDGTWWRLRSTSTYLPDDPAVGGVSNRIELTIQAGGGDGDSGSHMTLAEMTPSGVLMAAAGRMTFRNNLARQMLGPYAELEDPEGWVAALRPRHRLDVLEVLARASTEGARGTAVAALDRPGGATLWLRVEAAPATDAAGHGIGYVATLLDVTTETETHEQLQRAQVQLWQLANHDQLTGLPNRMQFTDRLERALAALRREHRPVALLYCDVDRFKPINDSFGHRTGDEVLVEVAHRLTAATRATDTVCRFGGDEFVVICEGFTDPGGIDVLGERLIEQVRQPIELTEGTVEVGLSVGIAHADAVSTVDGLLARADAALYRAKAAGRNRVEPAD